MTQDRDTKYYGETQFQMNRSTKRLEGMVEVHISCMEKSVLISYIHTMPELLDVFILVHFTSLFSFQRNATHQF